MSTRISDDASEDSQAQAHASHIVAPIDRGALIEAIETERQRIFRARALAQTAAKLLHELFVLRRTSRTSDSCSMLYRTCLKTRLQVWIAYGFGGWEREYGSAWTKPLRARYRGCLSARNALGRVAGDSMARPCVAFDG